MLSKASFLIVREMEPPMAPRPSVQAAMSAGLALLSMPGGPAMVRSVIERVEAVPSDQVEAFEAWGGRRA